MVWPFNAADRALAEQRRRATEKATDDAIRAQRRAADVLDQLMADVLDDHPERRPKRD